MSLKDFYYSADMIQRVSEGRRMRGETYHHTEVKIDGEWHTYSMCTDHGNSVESYKDKDLTFLGTADSSNIRIDHKPEPPK